MYTVVTIMDKPFARESSPVVFDGEEYWPTPSVPCLSIPQSVISSHGYSSSVIRSVFEGIVMIQNFLKLSNQSVD